MNLIEKQELNEIRQVFDDMMVRADRAFTETGGDELAHAIKAMVHIKKRLKRFSEGKIRMTQRFLITEKDDNGGWP